MALERGELTGDIVHQVYSKCTDACCGGLKGVPYIIQAHGSNSIQYQQNKKLRSSTMGETSPTHNNQ